MRAHELDRAFDGAEDVSAHVDWSGAERVNLGTGRADAGSRPGSPPRLAASRLAGGRDPDPETC